MLHNDFANSYKEFLLLLCGIILLPVLGGYNSFLAMLIALFAIFWLIKFFNKLFYETVFNTDGALKFTPASKRSFISDKLFITFFYMAICSVVVFMCLWLTEQSSFFFTNFPYLFRAEGADMVLGIILSVLSFSLSLTNLGLCLWILILLFNKKWPGDTCRKAWTALIILDIFLLPFLSNFIKALLPVSNPILWVLPSLIPAIIYIAIISVLLKKYYHLSA